MDTGRDLACPALWQESLERSLARRGRPTRSSLELFHLRAERDLSRPDLLRESLMYSQLRRSAVARRPSLAVPGAGGISALALLAVTTLPGLLGGRSGGRERIAYRAGATDAQAANRPREGLAVDPSLATKAAGALAGTSAAAAQPATRAAEPSHVLAPPAIAHVAQTSHPSLHTAHPTITAAAPRHIALAHDAADHASGKSVAHAPSGGVASAAPRISVAAPRVPAVPQPTGHPSTGGGAIEAASHTQAAGVSHPIAATPAHPVAGAHPVTTTHPVKVSTPHPVTTIHPVTVSTPQPVTPTHPVTATHPVATTHPVSVTAPAPKPPVSAPPPPASGSYVNPLAGARVTPQRIDQGVDYSGSGTLAAIGDGKVTYVGTSGTGWPGAFVEYQLTGGPDSGRYVYYAESISPAAGLHVGQTVRAGQPIASINGGIEIGWGSGVGTQPAAQADGQWSGGADAGNVASADGKSFSALIAQLGGPPGKVEG